MIENNKMHISTNEIVFFVSSRPESLVLEGEQVLEHLISVASDKRVLESKGVVSLVPGPAGQLRPTDQP